MSFPTYHLPGLRIAVSTQTAVVRKALDWMLQLFPQTMATPDLLLEASGLDMEDLKAAISPGTLAALPGDEADPILVESSSGELITLGRFAGLVYCATLNREQTHARLFCELNKVEPPQSTIQSIMALMLYPVLREVFLQNHCLLLHAAAIKCPNGTGIQLVAESGGGKTTTSLAMVRRGARLISDDLLVAGPGAAVRGLPKPLNLRAPTLGFFKELGWLAARSNPRTGKSSLIPQLIYGPACLASVCTVDIIYFLKLSQGRPAITRMPASMALKKLVEAHAFCIRQPTSGESLSGLCDLLASAAFYQLETGDNPEYLGQWLLDNCLGHARKLN